MTQDYSIRWGSTLPPFIGPGSELPDEGYAIEAMADGTNFGNPLALIEVVKSLLTDGSIAVLEGWDNREAPIRLRLSAPTAIAGPALAEAEAALMAAVLRRSKEPLVYVPPAQDAATSVFDVVAAKLERDVSDGWDTDEVLREYRYYLLTLTCLPFVRPENPIVVPALPPSPPTPTTVDIDEATSATGWTASGVEYGTVTRVNLITRPRPAPTDAAGSSFSPWTTNGTGYCSYPAESRFYMYKFNSPLTFNSGSYAPATAGTDYVLRGYYTPDGSGQSCRAEIYFYDAANVQVGSALGSSTSGGGVRTVTGTAPAGTTKMRAQFYNTSSGGTAMYITNVVLTTGTTDPGMFDGATEDAGGIDYRWSGTAYRSTSLAFGDVSAPVASGGSVTVTATAMPNGSVSRSLRLVRAGEVSLEDSPYLRVSVKTTPESGTVAFLAGTGSLSPIVAAAAGVSEIAGYTDYYFSGISSFDQFAIEISAPQSNLSAGSVSVAHIARTDTIISGGTTRQQARSAVVAGSAPTQAEIRLYDPTPAPLGDDILVHTCSNTGWQPPLRPWLVSGAGTPDSAMVSGARNTLASPLVYEAPAVLLTEGVYALMARASVTVAGTLTWSARIVDAAGGDTVGSSVVTAGSVSLEVTTGYEVVNLAALPLPVVVVEADQKIELTLTGTSDMSVDEGYLFGLTDGALTWLVDTDDLEWIQIRSPELGAARPSVYGGTGALGENSVCVDWKCQSFGAHRFDPGPIQVTTVASTSLLSQSELEFYPRYHSHVEGSQMGEVA